MNRKQFIKTAAVSMAVLPFAGLLPACQAGAGRKKVFVLVQLVGGNDGLNTLIPTNNLASLVAARPNIFIPEKKILPLKGIYDAGLHPAMSQIRDLFDHKQATFIQGVGYENPSYSHFRSLDVWLAGIRSSESISTGWVARMLEKSYPDYPQGFPSAYQPDPPAIKVGETGTFAFEGKTMDMSIVIDPKTSVMEPYNSGNGGTDAAPIAASHIHKIRNIIVQTGKYEDKLNSALRSSFTHSTLYPPKGENPLADQLKIVAKLIHAGLETQVYHVDLKGFDTHGDQVDASDTTKGAHADLLKKMSQAIHCFWDDIHRMGREQDVCGMVFSEFSRRIKSNASRGTDHGAAQPLLLWGAGLNGGIIGSNPTIPAKVTAGDNVEMQYDFKSVYASIVRQWMNGTEEHAKIVTGGAYKPLDIFAG